MALASEGAAEELNPLDEGGGIFVLLLIDGRGVSLVRLMEGGAADEVDGLGLVIVLRLEPLKLKSTEAREVERRSFLTSLRVPPPVDDASISLESTGTPRLVPRWGDGISFSGRGFRRETGGGGGRVIGGGGAP